MKKYLFIMVNILLGFSSCVEAASWSAEGNLQNLRVFNGAQVLVKLSGTTNSCGNATYVLDEGFEYFDLVKAMLLSAEVSNRPVKLYVTGCTTQGYEAFNGVQFSD